MGSTTRCKWAAGVLKSHFQELKDFYEKKTRKWTNHIIPFRLILQMLQMAQFQV